MKHQFHSGSAASVKRAVVCAVLVATGALLSGCKDESSSTQDQAALDKHNAEIARKNEVRNQIK
ncbi:MAG: hypothetical protein ACN6PJ_02960 [Achromobacter sp.]|uniref:hypothetical protein n=1 Tax=Achromobacter sp. TaxID=134375 RepID=UPI003D01A7C8